MAADPIDERYDEIVRRLRVLPGAPEELRARVFELGTAADVRRPRRRGLTLAVAVGLLVLAAVAGLILRSGGAQQRQAVRIRRPLGGFVRSVDRGPPRRGKGDPYPPVPTRVAQVQRTVSRLTALG